jgi:hypothetical protein
MGNDKIGWDKAELQNQFKFYRIRRILEMDVCKQCEYTEYLNSTHKHGYSGKIKLCIL